jgi:SIT family siderophore-iron:H+ symporter-like MFS transporter
MVEFDEKALPSPWYSDSEQGGRASTDSISPGVARIEATVEHITTANRVWIFFGVFLIAWAYGLDSVMRIAYQPIATSALNAHSLLATVTVVRAVIGAAAQVSVL